MKNKWKNYAIKDGKVKSSYIREYCNRKKSRKAGEAGNCNSILESGKVQQEEKVIYESLGKENPSEAHQEGQQRIQESTSGRCEVEKTNHEEVGEEEMKEKMSPKEKKHESKESKAYEKKEDKRESKKSSKKK